MMVAVASIDFRIVRSANEASRGVSRSRFMDGYALVPTGEETVCEHPP
jgi:hypothetical protein